MVKWNLDDLYKYEDKDKKKAELIKLVDDFVAKRSELTTDVSPETFLSQLEAYEKISQLCSVLASRAMLATCIDTKDQQLIKDEQEMEALITDLSNKILYFSIFFKDLSDEKAQEIIDATDTFKHHLQSIRKYKKHARSEEEEKIMNIKDLTGSSAMFRLYSIITNNFSFDIQGETKSEEEAMSLINESRDPALREEVYNAVLSKYKENISVLGEIYKNLAGDWRNETVDIRDYPSSISSRNVKEDLKDETVTTALDVMKDNDRLFAPYFAQKAKVLGYPNQRYHIYAQFPLKEEKEYSFEDSRKIVLEAYAAFDDEIHQLAKNVFDANHIDTDLGPGRRGGGFMYGADQITVPYIFMNCTNGLEDPITLAHEIGHAVHTQLSSKQSYFNSDYSLSLAEVASTFGELLLFDHFTKTLSEEQQLYLLSNHIRDIYKTLSRQSALCRFEIAAHEKIKEGATADEIVQIQKKIITAQHPGMEVPDIFNYEWLRIHHVFEYPFYVYNYAIAQMISLALFQEYKKTGTAFVEKYKKLFSRGGNGTVEEIMLEAGYDITKPEFWDVGFGYIKQRVDEFVELTNK